MNVNDIYSDIRTFWDNVYPILLFHLALLGIYMFLFPQFSPKQRIEKYIKSANYEKNKQLLENFELWKKLPYLLIIVIVVYFAVFNSVQSIVSSVRVFPFHFSYSTTRFISLYEPKEELVNIAMYGKDSSGDIHHIEQLRNKFVEEYKSKYPEKYDSYIEWQRKAFGKYSSYLNLATLLLLALVFLFIRQSIRAKTQIKILRFITAIIFLLFIIGALRYKAEQAIEGREAAEINFANTLLSIDNDIQPNLWEVSRIQLIEKLNSQEVQEIYRAPTFWISDIVQSSPFLESLLGERRIKDLSYRREVSHQPVTQMDEEGDRIVADTATMH